MRKRQIIRVISVINAERSFRVLTKAYFFEFIYKSEIDEFLSLSDIF